MTDEEVYEARKWYTIGCAIVTGPAFWTGDGTNALGLKTEVSEDGTVINISSNI